MDININATAKALVTGNIRSIRSRNDRDNNEILEISVPVNGRTDNEPATWYRVAFFGDRVANAKKRFSKGDLVQICGDIEVDAYAGKNGPTAAINVRFADVTKLRNAESDAAADESSDQDYGGGVSF